MKTILISLVTLFTGFLSQAGSMEIVNMRCGQVQSLSEVRQVCMSKNRADNARWVTVYMKTTTYVYKSEGFIHGGPEERGTSIERYRYYGEFKLNRFTLYSLRSREAPYTDITFQVAKYRSLSGIFMGARYDSNWMDFVQSSSGIFGNINP